LLAEGHQVPLCVESDCLKNLEADIAAGWADSLFSKPPASGMADLLTVTFSAACEASQLHICERTGNIFLSAT
jgi:hypothetical protein